VTVVKSQLRFAVPELLLQLGNAARHGRRIVLDRRVVQRKNVRAVEIGEGVGGNDSRRAGEELTHQRGMSSQSRKFRVRPK